MILKLVLFAVCCATTLAYSDGYYSSEEHHHHHHSKGKCAKLEFFKELQSPDSVVVNFVIRQSIFRSFKRGGKSYMRISCPNDSIIYLLLAYQQGATTKISGDVIKDASLLATGWNIGYVARCEDDKITGMTTNSKPLELEKIACVSLVAFPPTVI